MGATDRDKASADGHKERTSFRMKDSHLIRARPSGDPGNQRNSMKTREQQAAQRGPEGEPRRKLKIPSSSSSSVLLRLDLQLLSKLHHKNKAEFCCHSSSWGPLSMTTKRMM